MRSFLILAIPAAGAAGLGACRAQPKTTSDRTELVWIATSGRPGTERVQDIPDLQTTRADLSRRSESLSAGMDRWWTLASAGAVLAPVAGILALGRRRPAAVRADGAGSSRGRTVALMAAFLGALAIAGTGIVCWKDLREGWYVWRLRSTDPEAGVRALDRLVELKSARAVKPLLAISQREAGTTELGSRAALALLALSPDDSFHLYLEKGRSWHAELATACQDWVRGFLTPKLAALFQRGDSIERYDADWALRLLWGLGEIDTFEVGPDGEVTTWRVRRVATS